MTEQRISAFTSDRARAAYLAVYTRGLDRLWPVDRQSLDVATSLGPTRVHRTGRGDGVPVVLLPGAGGNSLSWHRHVARLGEAVPVVAVDPVGEPGGSDQRAPVGDGRDLARWLDEVLTALGIERAHLVGCSYGGWIAVRHALHAPNRAATITLLDPAGFGRITGRFLFWVIAGGLAGLTPAPLRRRLARWLRNATLRDDDLMRLAAATMRFRRRLPTPPTLTDAELRAVTVPTLVLLGERSQMYDAGQVADRLRRLLPDGRVEVVPGAGHDLPLHSPDLVTERTIAFIGQTEALA
ncbi:alpha/beta hydrolase [Micromonospora sp. WMMD812]|uniref:alpha/beta fold hydrolase n=1 Tax=Micromonospora sp. WMMD812 TaxID=3015152 RepID=UPI00248B4889|nr:alpha/beta hydrolase [Micromonospora sp. WMMD812]WBB67948.1 alpha/beta hydrolase [Micromonospora sp. WMMD812]